MLEVVVRWDQGPGTGGDEQAGARRVKIDTGGTHTVGMVCVGLIIVLL